eukprot:1348235-Pleurochrysis_carterae.AAC.1
MFYAVPVATDDEDHDLYGATRHIMTLYCKQSPLRLRVEFGNNIMKQGHGLALDSFSTISTSQNLSRPGALRSDR